MKPTIVLVHGAFAESASWDPVVDRLTGAGYAVIAAPNPLRGLASDAESVGDVVRSVEGPVLLAAHSYGGAVITNVDSACGEITGLVYIAAFAPDTGESANTLARKFAGSTLGDALRPIPRRDGTTDLKIAPELFHEQFAADVPAANTARMAVTQRPVTLEALEGNTGESPLWRQLPSWFLIAGEDRNIPPALQHFMAERAGSRRTVETSASHAASVSNPEATAELILEAAAQPVAT